MALDDLNKIGNTNGVYYRTESGRYHGVKLDRQFVISYKLGGKKYRGVVGWESDGCRVSGAEDKIREFKRNFKNGEGPLCLEEERMLAQERRKTEDELKRHQEAEAKSQARTVGDLIDEYWKIIKTKKSQASIRGHLDRISADLGDVLLSDLTLHRLQTWQASLKTLPRLSRVKKNEKPTDPLSPLSTLTVNRHIQTFKAMMTAGCNWGFITEDQLLKQVRKLQLDKERHRRRLDFLTREEAERLIDSTVPAVQRIIVCALQTGMRKEEILSLKWSHVDLEHRLIHLPLTKSGEPRSLYINDRLLETLKDKTLIRSIKDNHVFLNPDTKTRWSDLKTPFSKAVKRAKLDHRGIVFHHLRHTAASWMVMEGVPLLTIAKILGHADVQMVARYSHLTPDHLDKALAVLAQSPAKPSENSQQQAVG